MGIGLITVGTLFLLVSNHILLGWEHVWPLFPLVGGIFFLRVFRKRRTAELLFAGVSSVLLGAFLFMFSTGMLDWDRMAVLWPAIPLIAGLSMVVTSIMTHTGGPTLVVGSTTVLFAALMFFLESDAVSTRVAEPVIRFWPLVLILAGIIIFRMRPKEEQVEEDPGMKAVREVMEEDERRPAIREKLQSVDTAAPVLPFQDPTAPHAEVRDAIMARVRAATSPSGAIFELVHGLKTNMPAYAWVGVYRLSGDTLSVADGEFAGSVPEYGEVPLNSGICGSAAAARDTIVVSDVCNDPRYLAWDSSIKSEIVVPVIDDDVVVGVLDIDSTELNGFSDDDRIFLEALVHDVTPYIRLASPA